jgi:hypothetical protein
MAELAKSHEMSSFEVASIDESSFFCYKLDFGFPGTSLTVPLGASIDVLRVEYLKSYTLDAAIH